MNRGTYIRGIRGTGWGRGWFIAGLLLVLAHMPAVQAQGLKPAQPQPLEADLKPGLSVLYYYNMFRHIDELIEWESYREGKPGAPILELNYHVGEGKVLTSDSANGVGARISGFIHLQKPGFYAFSFQSNDGVRLLIDEQMIVEDPGVHADQFSDIGEVMIEEPGWYPLTVLYFERKVTSTLEFYWAEPGDDGEELKLVPASVLAHVPE